MDGGSGKKSQVNVFGEPLVTCSTNPVTGWYRSGCCETDDQDFGSHTVCVVVTREFLEFSKESGNDLCAARWLEAHQAGSAPRVYLRATHRRALEIVSLEDLKASAIDLS